MQLQLQQELLLRPQLEVEDPVLNDGDVEEGMIVVGCEAKALS